MFGKYPEWPWTLSLSQDLVCAVDEADYEWASQFKWHCTSTADGRIKYAARMGPEGRPIHLHRELVQPSPGQVVDHHNHDGLDNRRGNLRTCSHAENIRNQRKRKGTSSHFKGVWLSRSNNVWRVSIEQNRGRLDLGRFASEFSAARQYDRAARILFGRFALTNEDLGLYDGVEDRVLAASPSTKTTGARRRPSAFHAEMDRLRIFPQMAAHRRR